MGIFLYLPAMIATSIVSQFYKIPIHETKVDQNPVNKTAARTPSVDDAHATV